jgi:hypothetical protein
MSDLADAIGQFLEPAPAGDDLATTIGQFLSPSGVQPRYRRPEDAQRELADELQQRATETAKLIEDKRYNDLSTSNIKEKLDAWPKSTESDVGYLNPDAIGQRLESQNPGFRWDAVKEDYRNTVADEVRRMRLERQVNYHLEQGEDKPQYLAERLSILGAPVVIGNALELRRAANAIKDDKATNQDYSTIGRYLASQQLEAGKSDSRKFADIVTQLPATVAEWVFTGGLASAPKAAAEKAATRFLGKIGENWAVQKGIGLAAEGAARTAFNPTGLAAATAQQGVPQIGVDQRGQVAVGDAPSWGTALAKAAAAKMVENTVFSAGNPFGSQAGRTYLQSLGGAVAAGEVNKEAQYRLGLAPQGSVVQQLAAGNPDALKHFGIQVAAFGTLEGAIHGYERLGEKYQQMRGRGIAADSDRMREALAKEAENLINNPPEPTTPPEATQAPAPAAEPPAPTVGPSTAPEPAKPIAEEPPPAQPAGAVAPQTTPETAPEPTPAAGEDFPSKAFVKRFAEAMGQTQKDARESLGKLPPHVVRSMQSQFDATPPAPEPQKPATFQEPSTSTPTPETRTPAAASANDKSQALGAPTQVEAYGFDKPIPARYAVYELADLRPSHTYENGAATPNPGYPEELQPRDYSPRSEEDLKVRRFASEAKSGYYLSTHPGADSGPPTVAPDGTVINGNGRTMSLQLAARGGRFGWYSRDLETVAPQFGIDPKQLEGMKRPVLVRVVGMDPHSPDAAKFARAGNVSTTQAQSPVRTAASLSGLVTNDLLDSLRLGEDTTFSEAVTDPQKGKNFRQSLYMELPPSQRDQFFHPDQTLTDSGKELVRGMLLTKIMPVELIERLGDERKQLKNTVEGAIPQLLKLRRDHPDMDVGRPLAEALDVIARNPKVKTVADADNMLAQKSLFGGMAEPLSPEGRMMLDFVLHDGDKPRVFRTRLSNLLTGEAERTGLFGNVEPEDPQAMAARALGVEHRMGARFDQFERGPRGETRPAPATMAMRERTPLDPTPIHALYERAGDTRIPFAEVERTLAPLASASKAELVKVAEGMELKGMAVKTKGRIEEQIRQRVLDRRSAAQRSAMIQREAGGEAPQPPNDRSVQEMIDKGRLSHLGVSESELPTDYSARRQRQLVDAEAAAAEAKKAGEELSRRRGPGDHLELLQDLSVESFDIVNNPTLGPAETHQKLLNLEHRAREEYGELGARAIRYQAIAQAIRMGQTPLPPLNRAEVSPRPESKPTELPADPVEAIRHLHDRVGRDLTIPVEQIDLAAERLRSVERPVAVKAAEALDIAGTAGKSREWLADQVRQRLLDRRSAAQRARMIDEGAPGEMAFGGEPPKTAAGAGEPGDEKGPTGEPITPYEIIKTASKLFDVPYYQDRVVKRAAAVYKVKPEAIVVGRMSAGDAPVMMHEVAHHIDKANDLIPAASALPGEVARGLRALDYEPDRTDRNIGVKEGFAEYVRQRVTGQLDLDTPAKRAAGEWVEKKLAEHPDVVRNLDRITAMFERYGRQTPTGQAAAHLSTTGKPAEPELSMREKAADLVTRAKEWVQDNVDDNLAVLARMERDARGKGKTFEPGTAPHEVWFHLMTQGQAWADEMASHGVFTFRKNADGQLVKTRIGESLEDILSPLKPEDKTPWQGQASKFEVFSIARHALDEANRGRAFVDDATLAKYRDAMAELAKDPEFMKRATEAADKLTKGFNDGLDALAGVGFIDQEKADNLKEMRPTYVPTERVKERTGWRSWFRRRGEQVASPIKERVGSGEAIISPVMSYQRRLRVISFIMQEQLRRLAVHDAAQGEGMGKWMVEIARPVEGHSINAEKLQQVLKGMRLEPEAIDEIMGLVGNAAGSYFTPAGFNKSDKPAYVVMVDGKPQWYRVGDKALYDLLTNQQGESNQFVAKILRPMAGVVEPVTKMVRFGATTASHLFQLRNIFPTRDPAEFLRNTTSEAGYIKNVADLTKFYAAAYYEGARALFGAEHAHPAFDLYHGAGGEGLRQFQLSGKSQERAYADAMDRGSVAGKVTGRVVDGIKGVLEVMGAGEHAPRTLEFWNYLQSAGYSREVIERNEKLRPDQDPVPFPVIVAGMNAAAEVTTPFARKGVVTNWINKSVPFFGPHVAGLSKEIRNIKEMPQRAAVALAGYMALELLHWYTYKDEDWYKELDPNTRANYFVVKMPWGQLWYLPKVRGLYNSAAHLFQEGLRFQSNSNPKFDGWVQQTAATQTPPLLPAPAQVAADLLVTNRSWTGSPIVPKAEENLPWQQKLKHQVPYAAEQLTGGLVSERRLKVNPFTREGEPHASLNFDTYRRFFTVAVQESRVFRTRLRRREKHSAT